MADIDKIAAALALHSMDSDVGTEPADWKAESQWPSWATTEPSREPWRWAAERLLDGAGYGQLEAQISVLEAEKADLEADLQTAESEIRDLQDQVEDLQDGLE